MSIVMGSSYFLLSPLYQSLAFSSYSPSFFLYSNIRNAENNKKSKKKENAGVVASLRYKNASEHNIYQRRVILLVGISALPFIQCRAGAVESLVTGEQIVKTPKGKGLQRPENLPNEQLKERKVQSNPLLALLNAVGIIGSGVLGALYALAQKEKSVTEATIESMKNKLSKRESSMTLLEKNTETMLLKEQEETKKQIRRTKEEQQSLLNQVTSASSTITSLQQEVQSGKRTIEELQSQINGLQNDLTKVRDDKKKLEANLKAKVNSIESLQEKTKLLSLEVKDKEENIQNLSSTLSEKVLECNELDCVSKQAKADIAEANTKIKGLEEEVFRTQKELNLKHSTLDDLNVRISSLIAERVDTNRKLDALQEGYNDMKLSSEKKAALDAELLAKREHEVHQLEEKLGLSLDEASNNQELIGNLIQERDDLKKKLEIEVIHVKDLTHDLQITQETLGTLKLEASDLSKQLKQSRKFCEELKSEISRVQTELVEEQESSKRSLNEAVLNLEVLSAELTSVRATLKETKEELQNVSNELAATTEVRENLKEELLVIYKKAETATYDLKEEKKIVASLNKDLEASENQILKDKEASKTLKRDLEEAAKALDKMNKNALLLSREIKMAGSRISSLEDEKDVLYKSLLEQKNISKETRENLEDAHKLIMMLGKERENLEKTTKKLEEDLASAKGEILRLRSQINSSRSTENDHTQNKSIVEDDVVVVVKKNGRRAESQLEASQ